jgi:putative SOS response-associated peptidase YedK
MCGRFSQAISATAIADTFQVAAIDLPPHYNVAPSQPVAAIVQLPDAPRQLRLLQWGLIPAWAKDPSIGYKTINARAETAAQKPSFRAAFRHRRCLIPADGFYEWQQATERQSKKQPYFIGLQACQIFAFAGLHERWETPTGDILETCTILTTTANELIAPIHERMPVILAPDEYALWLDAGTEIDRLQALLDPYPAAAMQLYPVSTLVNSPKNDIAECRRALTV